MAIKFVDAETKPIKPVERAVTDSHQGEHDVAAKPGPAVGHHAPAPAPAIGPESSGSDGTEPPPAQPKKARARRKAFG